MEGEESSLQNGKRNEDPRGVKEGNASSTPPGWGGTGEGEVLNTKPICENAVCCWGVEKRNKKKKTPQHEETTAKRAYVGGSIMFSGVSRYAKKKKKTGRVRLLGTSSGK